MLVVNQWFQKGQADASTLKKYVHIRVFSYQCIKLHYRHFSKSQPSGILPSQMAYCIYITLAKEYADLPVDEPKVPVAPEVEKRDNKGRKRVRHLPYTQLVLTCFFIFSVHPSLRPARLGRRNQRQLRTQWTIRHCPRNRQRLNQNLFIHIWFVLSPLKTVVSNLY